MAEPNPALEAQKQHWHDKHRALERQASESSLLTPVEDCHRSATVELPQALRHVRDTGYVFAADLDDDVRDLGRRVGLLADDLRAQARNALRDLSDRLDRMRDGFRRLDAQSFGDPSFSLGRLSSELDDASERFERLKQSIATALADFPDRAAALTARLATIRQYIDHARGASFSFSPDEKLYLAVPAEWEKTGRGKDDPDGILHVTDRRLIMERKEREGGFLGFGGKAVQGVLWELPWDQVDGLRPEQRGLMGGVDLIHFRLKPGSPLGVDELTVEVKGGLDADAFAEQLRPALDGRLASQRLPGR